MKESTDGGRRPEVAVQSFLQDTRDGRQTRLEFSLIHLNCFCLAGAACRTKHLAFDKAGGKERDVLGGDFEGQMGGGEEEGS